MRIEPTATGGLAGGVQSARLATMRDPTLAAIEVLVTDITETGATLRADATLPKDTLVSLGLAGAGRVLARIVRAIPGAMKAEFTAPLDARQMRRLATVETLAAVATPQLPADRATAPTRPAPVAATEPPYRAVVTLPQGETLPTAVLVYGASGGAIHTAPAIPTVDSAVVDARERIPFGPVPSPLAAAARPGTGLRWIVVLIVAATLVYLLL